MASHGILKMAGALAVGLLMALPSASAWAVEAEVTGSITRTLAASGGRWGGCMAQLNAPLSNEGLDCTGSWVTFSCAGTGAHASKEDAARLFDAALLAFALDQQVRVTVDDAKQQGGYCYASRVEVLED